MKRLLLLLLVLISSVARADFVTKTCVTDLGGCFIYQLDSVGRQQVYFSNALSKLITQELALEYSKMGIGIWQLDAYRENLLSPMIQKVDIKTVRELQDQVVDLGEDAILSSLGCVAATAACGASVNPGTYILTVSACVGAAVTCRFAMKTIEKWKASRKEYQEKISEGKIGGVDEGDHAGSGGSGFGGLIGGPARDFPSGVVTSEDCPDGGCPQ